MYPYTYIPERPLSPPEPENGWCDIDETEDQKWSRIRYEDRKESIRGDEEDDVDFDDGLEDDESE